MEENCFDVDTLIDGLIEREGGYVNHPADKGGPTCFGITEAVARSHDLGLAKHISDRVVFLDQGRVYAEDLIENLLRRDDPVIEDFFGEG